RGHAAQPGDRGPEEPQPPAPVAAGAFVPPREDARVDGAGAAGRPGEGGWAGLTAAGRPRRVHQLLAALAYGDAISNEALAIQEHLRRAGFDSDVFAEAVHPRMAGRARPLWQYEEVSAPDTVCLFHFSIGSAA